jgi:hypothetical protein
VPVHGDVDVESVKEMYRSPDTRFPCANRLCATERFVVLAFVSTSVPELKILAASVNRPALSVEKTSAPPAPPGPPTNVDCVSTEAIDAVVVAVTFVVEARVTKFICVPVLVAPPRFAKVNTVVVAPLDVTDEVPAPLMVKPFEMLPPPTVDDAMTRRLLADRLLAERAPVVSAFSIVTFPVEFAIEKIALVDVAVAVEVAR